MKKILTFSLFTFTFSFLSAFAAANDRLITFSTPGPDRYADGTAVLDGECYALVWTKTGATFAGITADGKAVDPATSAVLVAAPVAKGGRCPTVVFELDADLAEAYAGGSYGIYLLDTRLANGLVGGLDAEGVPLAVNAFGEVKGKSEEGKGAGSSTSQLFNFSTSQLVSVTTKSALPADAPKPQITAIRIVGDKVFLTVRNTIPSLQYAAKEMEFEGQGGGQEGAISADQPSTFNLQPVAAQGAATADAEITVIAPKKGERGFFSVGRK